MLELIIALFILGTVGSVLVKGSENLGSVLENTFKGSLKALNSLDDTTSKKRVEPVE